MPLLAIDPGLQGTGWALFNAGNLERCGIVGSDPSATLWTRAGEAAQVLVEAAPRYDFIELVVEKPQVYKQSKSKGDPNDLVDLGILIGIIVRAINPKKARLVRPRDWKGTIPKAAKLDDYVVHRRNVKTLARSTGETRRYELGLKTTTAKLRHNIADAVGLGLWALT